MSIADELKKLKELLDSGVLSQEEFDVDKEKLLESLTKLSGDLSVKNNRTKTEIEKKEIQNTVAYA